MKRGDNVWLQLLGEMNCKLANVALGAGYIDKESKDPYWAPMIDIKRDFKIRSKLTLKNRVRYIYEIIEKADKALYKSKNSGRNKVSLWLD